jgi:hypothetical protein
LKGKSHAHFRRPRFHRDRRRGVFRARRHHARSLEHQVSAGVNQDGSLYRTVAPKARTAEITFDRFVDNERQPLRWAENIMLQVNLGITFVEQDTGVTHILSGGFFTGKPTMDTSTGEVSGLALAADSYKTIT